MTAISASAAAPAQLACHGKATGAAAPFLVSPYAGWTEINSFVDHDNPDYGVDGTIVLANGLTATAGDGEGSDYFATYWSPALRQFISYDGHNGYDFGISYQPVLAAADGTVEYAGWNGSSQYEGYGQMVLINHHNGYVTLYGHLSQLEVKTGDRVTAGQEIGISGSTGNSTGPHLHFSVFHNCQVTDPYGWTGHGTDPLYRFDGEHATYLWLPSHDPLVLNPPPGWPTFPTGLKVQVLRIIHAHLIRISRKERLRGHAPGQIPPVDRLLLLELPQPESGAKVSGPVALARTEAAITQEAEALAPNLEDLSAERLVESYQVVPAAAAVWVRGTATAAELEGLPGVASLSGVRTRDLQAAQTGLSHSVLIQVRRQQAPSLWPVGFRSALHTWRPIATVSAGHALVMGIGLPGQRVIVTLQRGASIPAAAEAMTDPESGGFVAMLHDRFGSPRVAQPGDVVTVETGGREAQVQVGPFSLRARSNSITGQGPPNRTVVIGLADPASSQVRQIVTTADQWGRFGLTIHGPLPAGTLAVASVVDAAGDEESATAFVPGVVAEEGSSTVYGWTLSKAPHLTVLRRGRLLVTRRLSPAPDGTFQIDLERQHHPLSLAAGDALTIGTRWHHRTFALPSLSLALTPGSPRVRLRGPARVRVRVTYLRSGGTESTRAARLESSGHTEVTWPGGVPSTGDQATLQLVRPTGDTILVTHQVRGIVVHEGEPWITGQVRPGTTVSLHVSGPAGQPLAAAIVASDAESGAFSAAARDAQRHPVTLEAGMRVDVRDTMNTLTYTLPALSLATAGHNLWVHAPTTSHATDVLTITGLHSSRQAPALTRKGPGLLAARLDSHISLPAAGHATLTVISAGGVSVERTFSLTQIEQPSKAPTPARTKATKPRS